MHEDAAEIAGIPARLLRAFSRRHEQIAEWLDAAGESGPAAAADAQRATRQPSRSRRTSRRSRPTGMPAPRSSVGGRRSSSSSCASGRPGGGAERVRGRERDVAGRRPAGASRLVGFDEWLDWLLDTRSRQKTGRSTASISRGRSPQRSRRRRRSRSSRRPCSERSPRRPSWRSVTTGINAHRSMRHVVS